MTRMWSVGDRVAKGDDRGTVKELFQSGSLVHRLVVEWDRGGETLEITSAVALAPEPDLNRGSNLFGPLPGEVRARLVAVMENPTEETWDDAQSIILNAKSWATLWQAVVAVDPSYGDVSGPVTRWVEDDSELGGHSEPVSGWGRIPTRDVIERAIRYATEETND